MKKIISIMLCVVMLAGILTACGTDSKEENVTQDTTTLQQTEASKTESTEETQKSGNGASKALVVYYSATGTTKSVAEKIADAMIADTFELTPVKPYTDDDLDWTDDDSRVCKEHEQEDTRHVELTATTVSDFDSYNVVFIGYPIWWGIAAWPVDDFVKENDFSGKTVIPFCTSASSGLGESGELLEQMAGTGNWLTGERFTSGTTEDDVKDWVGSLNLGK